MQTNGEEKILHVVHICPKLTTMLGARALQRRHKCSIDLAPKCQTDTKDAPIITHHVSVNGKPYTTMDMDNLTNKIDRNVYSLVQISRIWEWEHVVQQKQFT